MVRQGERMYKASTKVSSSEVKLIAGVLHLHNHVEVPLIGGDQGLSSQNRG